MKILVKGKTPIRVCHVTCPRCSSILECEESDIIRNENRFIHTICINCKQTIVLEKIQWITKFL